jgi:hypothetical protein
MVKKLLVIGMVLACFSSEAYAARKTRTLAKVCSRVQDAGNASSTIYKNSAPLRSGGVGSPLIGFRKEPTLIMNRNISSKGTKPIYDANGNKLASCPWASAHGHSGGRFRCTIQTSTLRRAAIRNTRSPAVFFNVTGKTCVRVPDAGKCYGSVKGLCNQTIS